MRSLRGQLLVAGPALDDPNFRRTVVLLGEHGDDGAMGVVLNRISSITVADAVPPVAALVGDGAFVHVGGPVQPQAVVVLADFVEPERAGALVLDTIGFLPGDVDDELELGELRNARVFAGYAGWGAGQLEEELANEDWILEPALADDAFTADPDELWRDVLRRKGGIYELVARMPEDPSLN